MKTRIASIAALAATFIASSAQAFVQVGDGVLTMAGARSYKASSKFRVTSVKAAFIGATLPTDSHNSTDANGFGIRIRGGTQEVSVSALRTNGPTFGLPSGGDSGYRLCVHSSPGTGASCVTSTTAGNLWVDNPAATVGAGSAVNISDSTFMYIIKSSLGFEVWSTSVGSTVMLLGYVPKALFGSASTNMYDGTGSADIEAQYSAFINDFSSPTSVDMGDITIGRLEYTTSQDSVSHWYGGPGLLDSLALDPAISGLSAGRVLSNPNDCGLDKYGPCAAGVGGYL